MPIDISQLISEASSGNIDAQLQLADLYESGFGVPVDFAQAAYWYRKAADAGSAKAQNQLGQFFISNRGVPQDNSQAFHWFSLSANQKLRQTWHGVINVALVQKKTMQ